MTDLAGGDRRVLQVDDESEGTRVDLFLAERVEGISRSRIQRLIREGRVHINGRSCNPSATGRSVVTSP